MATVMVALLSVGFAACSSDDDNGQSFSQENLYGLWEICHIQGEVVEDNKKTTFDMDLNSSEASLELLEELDVVDFCRYEFNKDNTFNVYDYENNGFRKAAPTTAYKLEGNQLIIGTDDDQNTATVVSLSENQLVIYSDDKEEGLKMTATFKRINQ